MIEFKWEPRDLWVGVYVGEEAVYICLLPTVVIKISWRVISVEPLLVAMADRNENLLHYKEYEEDTKCPSSNLLYGKKYDLRTFSVCQCADTCAKCGEYVPDFKRMVTHLVVRYHVLTPSVCECVSCTCEKTPFLYHRNECEVSIAYHKLEEEKHGPSAT